VSLLQVRLSPRLVVRAKPADATVFPKEILITESWEAVLHEHRENIQSQPLA
jgi:hypothetical protein